MPQRKWPTFTSVSLAKGAEQLWPVSLPQEAHQENTQLVPQSNCTTTVATERGHFLPNTQKLASATHSLSLPWVMGGQSLREPASRWPHTQIPARNGPGRIISSKGSSRHQAGFCQSF